MSQMGSYAEVSKLVGTGASGNAQQGISVMLSEDGNFLFVGGPFDSTSIGAVWFYEKISGVWTQRQKILPTGYSGTQPFFGWSVAVNPSMTTMIVGSYYDNNGVGALYVFSFDGTTWTQEGNKLVGNQAGSSQGFDVALSVDGNTAIVGGPFDANFLGAAWIFVRSGNTWAQQGSKLVANDSSVGNVGQGLSVALTSDGNLAIVGGPYDNSNQGAIWVYLRSGISWNQVGTKITGTDVVGAGFFGWSLALSGDDQTVVVGGSDDNSLVGAAWIFKRNGNTFTQFGSKLVGTGASPGAKQGFSVSVNKLGTFVAVGTYADSSYAGAVFMYYFNGTKYNQLGNKIVAADAIGKADQGKSVALDGSGSQLLFGGNADNGNIGAAWIYTYIATTQPSVIPTTQPSLEPTAQPSLIPTTQPSLRPTTQPSIEPTTQPSVGPTTQPSFVPTTQPSFAPSLTPTVTTSKPTSFFSSTSSGAFLSLVTVVPVLVLAGCALMYFFLRVYKKRVNNEGAEMKNWIDGNKGEITLNTEKNHNGEDNENDDNGLNVAPMDNPLQTSSSSSSSSRK